MMRFDADHSITGACIIEPNELLAPKHDDVTHTERESFWLHTRVRGSGFGNLYNYRGATLDVMVAFSDRPIVFRYQEKRNCFQLVYSTTVTIHPPSMYTLAPQCNDSINS